jgi:hypothetical protein
MKEVHEDIEILKKSNKYLGNEKLKIQNKNLNTKSS